MSKFKVGDNVEVINSGYTVPVGTIGSIRQQYGENSYVVNFPFLFGKAIYFYEHDIALVTPKDHSMTNFIVAKYSSTGIYSVECATKPVVHSTRQLAEQEAERLAKANPNVKFFVYQLVSVAETMSPPVALTKVA